MQGREALHPVFYFTLRGDRIAEKRDEIAEAGGGFIRCNTIALDF